MNASSNESAPAAEKTAPADLRNKISALTLRVHEKISDYDKYQFSKQQSRSMNIFFDLAQEFGGEDDLWALSVIIPKVFFDKNTTLYMLAPENRLELKCAADLEADHPNYLNLDDFEDMSRPLRREGRLFIPIKGNRELLEFLPVTPKDDVIGMIVFEQADDISRQDALFFEKYANRIGYRLHGRIISEKNREHLEFIQTLVEDIGHNVIVPNMYFKLYYRRLESKIQVLRDIGDQFSTFTDNCTGGGGEHTSQCRLLKREMDYAFEALMDQYSEIYRHYEQTSLFLETLLRRSHFEEGRYVLEMRPVPVFESIITPQLERYRHRFEDRGVDIAPGPEKNGEDVNIMADFGLISQVFANLVSNAAKYAQDVQDQNGRTRKFVEYGWELLPQKSGEDRPRVKIYVFSSGPTIADTENPRLFEEGFRGSNASGEYGTGHGLSFVREVVALHGGTVGYEARPLGNIFSFTLPVAKPQEPDV
ncbi:MAG: sensor histidine kinase [Desulfovibrio sp.]|uniref:sensor histidine kinase n=1 Tax=Desulfovibrio sp. 7SRBS1 TaxID=3378064 RepID=UPI003B3F854A